MEYIVHIAIAVLIIGLLLLLFVQARHLKQYMHQAHQAEERAKQVRPLTKRETAILCSARVKDSKRRARQRKGHARTN